MGVLATGLLANSVFAPVFARMAGRLANTINIYTNGGGGKLANELRPLLKGTNKYRFIDVKIEKFEKDREVVGEAGVVVKLEDGREIDEAFIVCLVPRHRVSARIADLDGAAGTRPLFQAEWEARDTVKGQAYA